MSAKRKPPVEKLNVRISAERKHELDAVAKASGITRNDVINAALHYGLREMKQTGMVPRG